MGFPGFGSIPIVNEAGEPIGWDSPSEPDGDEDRDIYEGEDE